MLNKKAFAVEAFRKSAALCVEAFEDLESQQRVRNAKKRKPSTGVTNEQSARWIAVRDHLARKLQSLGDQIRLCGDMAAAMKVYQRADDMSRKMP